MTMRIVRDTGAIHLRANKNQRMLFKSADCCGGDNTTMKSRTMRAKDGFFYELFRRGPAKTKEIIR